MCEQENLPYVEDVLAQTRTHRDDWLIGARSVWLFLGAQNRYGHKFSPHFAGAVKVRNTHGGATQHMWMVRKRDIEYLRDTIVEVTR